MKYGILIAPFAQRALKKFDNLAFKRLTSAIEKLANNPRPAGYKKLEGGTDEFRIRVGDYRIIYSINDKEKIILILAFGHRREIYR